MSSCSNWCSQTEIDALTLQVNHGLSHVTRGKLPEMKFAELDTQELKLATYLEEVRQTSFSSRYHAHASVWVCVRCKTRFPLVSLGQHIDNKLVKCWLAYSGHLLLLGIRTLSSTNKTLINTLTVMCMRKYLHILCSTWTLRRTFAFDPFESNWIMPWPALPMLFHDANSNMDH